MQKQIFMIVSIISGKGGGLLIISSYFMSERLHKSERTVLLLGYVFYVLALLYLWNQRQRVSKYVSWMNNTTNERQIMICEKQVFLIWGLFSHKLAQIRDSCSFIQLFYLDLNDLYMLKIWEFNDRNRGTHPYLPLHDVMFIRGHFSA